ncbi:MAG: class I tRNA ligase family protein [bacterium]
MELDVLRFWEEGDIFQKTLAKTSDKKPYIFYDGPPFATGLPHHGHIVASTIKDIVPRYWTMKGRYVLRRFGWDCHGLPIEHEIDKQLSMSAQQAVEELGVAGYNAQCRSIVQRYVSEWRNTITRLGRWVDFDNDYKTMDPEYMESVWWVVKQLWDKGLGLSGRAHHAVVDGARHAAVELRSEHELHGRAGPVGDGAVRPGRRERLPRRLDYDPLDAAVQPRGVRGSGHRLRARQRPGDGQAHLPGRGAPARLWRSAGGGPAQGP